MVLPYQSPALPVRARWTERNWIVPRWRIVGCDAGYLTRTDTVFE